MKTQGLVDYCSIGEGARQLGEPLHRVTYAMKKLRVEPVAKIGGRWLYRREDFDRVAAEFEAIDARRIASKRVNKRG